MNLNNHNKDQLKENIEIIKFLIDTKDVGNMSLNTNLENEIRMFQKYCITILKENNLDFKENGY